MPLINMPDNPPKQEELPLLAKTTITDTNYRHNIVESTVTPLNHLIVFVEGSTLTVDYYQTVIGRDTEVSSFEQIQMGIYQQYNKIEKFELRLQGSLSPSFDDETGELTHTGSAIVYPGMLPNYGDLFICDVGDGKAGLFMINSAPQQKSVFNQSCYEITFIQIRYINQALVDIINSKVVKVTHFVRDYLKFGQNPFLSTKNFNLKTQLELQAEQLLELFCKEMFSYEFKTFAVPEQPRPVYDHFLVSTFQQLFDPFDHPTFKELKMYNIDEFAPNRQMSIWQALLHRKEIYLPLCFTELRVVGRNCFNRLALLNSFRYTKFWGAVIPSTTLSHYDKQLFGTASAGLQGVLNGTPDNKFPNLAGSMSYVFSKNFYEGRTEHLTTIEVLALRYIRQESVDAEVLVDLCQSVFGLTSLQRYYFIPVLLIMLKSTMRTLV